MATTAVDLTGDTTEEDEPPLDAGGRATSASPRAGERATSASPRAAKRQRAAGTIEYLSLPGGVLDDLVLGRVSAIAQQNNCVGVDGKGLAAGVAAKLPYGCPYASRRPMPPANRFAVPEDRATPGTIALRKAPAAVFGVASRPDVICIFGQWEMGGPDKYQRVTPRPASDGAAAREGWFREALTAIAHLSPRPASVAFPREIGCGLAGGNWTRYERMLEEFATAHPQIEVLVVRWMGGGGGGSGSGSGSWRAGRGRAGGGARGAGGGGAQSGTCFKCGQPGHWANGCPAPR